MIFGKLNPSTNDRVYPTAIRKALAYLRETDVMALAPGRYEIDGERLFLNVMDMTTHGFEGSHPEIHKKYADLFYWPEGGEKIGVSAYTGKETICEAKWENDIAFLESAVDESFLIAKEGDFAVFFPWDAHRPALMLGDAPATSRKCVIKIQMTLFDEP